MSLQRCGAIPAFVFCWKNFSDNSSLSIHWQRINRIMPFLNAVCR